MKKNRRRQLVEWDENLIANQEDRDWLYRQSETKRESILYRRSQRRLKKKSRSEAIKKFYKRKNSNSTLTSLVPIDGVKEFFEEGKKESQVKKDTSTHKRSLFQNTKPKLLVSFFFPKIRPNENLKTDEKNLSVNILRISQIRRDALERIYDEPWTNRFVEGLFTRLSIGERNNVQVYRICEIHALKNYHRKYIFGTCVTKKSLMVKLNRKKEFFTMILVSNKQFKIREFEIWYKIMKYTNTLTSSSEKLQDLVVKRHYYRKKFNYTRKNLQKIQKQKLVEQLKNLKKIKNLFAIKLQIQTDKQKADYKKDRKQSEFLKNLLLKIEKEQRIRN